MVFRAFRALTRLMTNSQYSLSNPASMPLGNAAKLSQTQTSDNHSIRRTQGGRALRTRLCSYITRPALFNDRVKINAKGQVELKLKTRGLTAPRII